MNVLRRISKHSSKQKLNVSLGEGKHDDMPLMEEKLEEKKIDVERTWKNSKKYFEEEVKLFGPRTVKVFFKLIQVDKIDCIDSEISVDFVFFRRWYDPCMINAIKEHGFGDSFKEYDKYAWRPDLEINNDVSLKQLWPKESVWQLKDENTGLMQLQERFRGCVSYFMTLNAFPFDRFPVYINIGPAMYNMSKLYVMIDKEEQKSFDANTWTTATQWALPHGHPAKKKKAIDFTLEEWNISPEIYTYIYEKPGRGKWNLQNVNHGFEIVRESTFYLYKIISIEVLLTVWSWSVFFFAHEELISKFKVTLALFLAAVTFLFVVNDKLPRVAYLTLLDKNVLGTFVLLFLCAFESWIVYELGADKDADEDGPFDRPKTENIAEILNTVSKILFPIMYLYLNAMFFRESPEVREIIGKVKHCWCCVKYKKWKENNSYQRAETELSVASKSEDVSVTTDNDDNDKDTETTTNTTTNATSAPEKVTSSSALLSPDVTNPQHVQQQGAISPFKSPLQSPASPAASAAKHAALAPRPVSLDDDYNGTDATLNRAGSVVDTPPPDKDKDKDKEQGKSDAVAGGTDSTLVPESKVASQLSPFQSPMVAPKSPPISAAKHAAQHKPDADSTNPSGVIQSTDSMAF